MARTPSQMIDLGTEAPTFSLPDVVSGETISLDSFPGARATWSRSSATTARSCS